MEASAGSAREERKVVTVLFADLVGFTSRSEQLDPEDVRATLTPYFARLREELVAPEPQVVDGRIALPQGPGLGIDLVDEVVERYRVA